MKSTIKTAAWICVILLVSVSCYDDGTDCFDTATRISLYPDVELFNADGTTASGNESFVSAVTVNVGPAVSDMAWEASVPASAAWATVRRTTVASTRPGPLRLPQRVPHRHPGGGDHGLGL